MNKILRILIVAILTLSLMIFMASCGDKNDNADDGSSELATEEQVETDDSEDSGDGTEDSADDSEEEVGPSEGAKIIDTIDNIDSEDDQLNLPLQISAINLYDDGTIEIIPTDELKEIELRGSDKEAIYPFAEFGAAEKIYLVNYGNAGYRTILALMEDGTIAAVNGRALIEDHVIAVAPHITGRDDFKSVKNYTDDGGSGVIGITTEGKEIDLDNSLNLQ